ncbi:hypothetical protein D3C72_2159100 [compost metagenome]
MAASQHQACIRLYGKAGVFGVFAVVHFDQVALLQVAQQSFTGLFQGFGRYGKTLITRAQQEVRDISRQPVLLFAIGAP